MSRRSWAGKTSVLEWAAALFGAAVLAAMIFVLGREALAGREDAPAAIVLSAERIHQLGSGHAVEVEARNAGGATAADVQLEGALMDGGEEVEKAAATLDYLPGQSRRRAVLYFTRDPADHRLELRATGYQQP
ncbi:MAG: hypothetical protein ACT4OE_09300 [Sphingosinicella sp.]